MDAVKSAEKIIQESAFERRKKKPRLKFNFGLAISLFFSKFCLYLFRATLIFLLSIGRPGTSL